MTTEERTEHPRHEVLLNKLEREVFVIAAAQAANAQSIKDTKIDLEQQIKQVDHRVMVLDAEVHKKLDAMSVEHIQHKALLEDLGDNVRVIAEGYAANAQSIQDTRTKLGQQITQVDHRVMVLDVKVHTKLDSLEARMGAKIGALSTDVSGRIDSLEARMDAKIGALSTDVSALSTDVSTLSTDVSGRIDSLEARMDAKIGALSTDVSALSTDVSTLSTIVSTLSTELSRLSTDFSRLSTHLGLDGAPPPAKPV